MADFRITVDSRDLVTAKTHTDQLKQANNGLRTSLGPLVAKERELRAAVDLVRQSVDLGVISHKEAKAAVQRLGTQYGKTSKEMRTMASSMGGLRKNTNRMNAMFQNAGYQIGDFAVQVQSGQNVLVAFSQQGAQLAGLLPGLTGALTGVGLVVGTSLLRAFTEGSTMFKSFSDLISEASESAKNYASALRDVKEAIDLELGPEILEFSRIKIRQELQQTTESAIASIEKLSEGRFFKVGLEQKLAYLQSQLEGAQNVPFRDMTPYIESLNKEIASVTAALQTISTIETANLSRQNEVRKVIGAINELIDEHADGLKLSGDQLDEIIGLNNDLKEITKLLLENETYANEAKRAGIELTKTAMTREEAYNQMLERKAQNEAKILSLKKEQVEEQTKLNALTGASTSGSSSSGGSTRVIPSSNSVGSFSSSSSYTSPGGLFQLNVGGGGGATGVGGMFSFPKLFASGGVVNRATSFMTTSGRMGVMGEAGPEAILPLKRGANGQLGVQAGGGSGVVINQSFNFVANGDESVKKIIAEEAPRIAKYTEQQIINSRQRGGQMRRAFN